jgi:hypothetical protein
VQNLSSRAARLYLARLDDLLGFAVTSQLAARTRPHCRFVFLRSRVCYPLLSASPRGYALRFTTVAVIGSGWLLSSNEILPMLGTLGQDLILCGTDFIGTTRRQPGVFTVERVFQPAMSRFLGTYFFRC